VETEVVIGRSLDWRTDLRPRPRRMSTNISTVIAVRDAETDRHAKRARRFLYSAAALVLHRHEVFGTGHGRLAIALSLPLFTFSLHIK
jgi:hypothetical protein